MLIELRKIVLRLPSEVFDAGEEEEEEYGSLWAREADALWLAEGLADAVNAGGPQAEQALRMVRAGTPDDTTGGSSR